MKKIIALLCTVVMLSASVTAVSAADAENTSDKFLILSELGIDTTPASGYATKDYFIAALMGFFYDEGYKPEIEEFARVAEIVKFGEIYKGSENLTVGDALEYAAIALGYKGYAENGSYGNIINFV